MFLITLLRLLKHSSFAKIDGGKKKYPKVIQLPITYNCNSRCIMCSVWQMDHSGEADCAEFGRYMRDRLFEKVEYVGINGGEPSLVKELHKYAEEILKLPSLKGLNIISHGFNSKLLLKELKKIYVSCKAKGVLFHVAISLDGVGKIHNTVRGKRVFDETIATIDEIVRNQEKYCDMYDLGCTVIKQNVDYLIELDAYAKKKDYNIKYRLGISNKRIESDKKLKEFSVIFNRPKRTQVQSQKNRLEYNAIRQTAKEFFHYQIYQSDGLMNKFKYFSLFIWLDSVRPKRMLGCMWKDEGVTLDSRGELYYCAVASKSIGTLRSGKGENIFFNNKNIDYRKQIIEKECDNCIHDYTGRPELKNIYFFLQYMLKNRFSMKIYKIKARLFV